METCPQAYMVFNEAAFVNALWEEMQARDKKHGKFHFLGFPARAMLPAKSVWFQWRVGQITPAQAGKSALRFLEVHRSLSLPDCTHPDFAEQKSRSEIEHLAPAFTLLEQLPFGDCG